MKMFLWMAFSILWTAIGIVTVAWFARRKQAGLLSALRVGLPAFTAMTMLIVVAVSRHGSLLPRILHDAGFTILGVFLLATEFLRLILRRLPEGRDFDAESLMLCRTFRTVTLLFAPASAIIILISGWRLMYDFGWSLLVPWLWWVYVLFVTMMWHGAFYWTAEADQLASKAESGRARLPRCADWIMTLHGLFFLVIFAIAYDRGATPLPHPCPAAIVWMEHCLNFLPSTWRSVGAAVALWGVVGLLIGCAFKLGNRRTLPG
jgi:uncharacterized membrane protein